jgi:hypothetical protein
MQVQPTKFKDPPSNIQVASMKSFSVPTARYNCALLASARRRVAFRAGATGCHKRHRLPLNDNRSASLSVVPLNLAEAADAGAEAEVEACRGAVLNARADAASCFSLTVSAGRN